MNLLNAPVTLTLLFANAAIFLWTNYSDPVYFEKFAGWPYEIIYRKKYYQLITSAFLHANWPHLLFNLFTLYNFGIFLEYTFRKMANSDALGSIYFAMIYFISLLFGSLLMTIFHYKNPQYIGVGASGAVSGIVFSYIIFYPFSKLLIFFFPMPAFIFAFLYVGVSIYGMRSQFGNIGHEAHLGGAIGGVLSTLLIIDGALSILISHFS